VLWAGAVVTGVVDRAGASAGEEEFRARAVANL
jgi:hypothetical protein